MWNFPENLSFEISKPIDAVVKWLLVNWDGFFDGISKFVLGVFNIVEGTLGIVPWWLMLIGLFYAGFKLYNVKTAVVLTGMLFTIGLFGLWELMIYTLVIVIIAVLVSVVIGLPMGILMAKSEVCKRIMMPVLDAMQTMPSFVYLLPAVMFFGLGKVPAVIATTTYAVPPLIRLTYLGISTVDKEVIEAGKSFGSTTKQMLLKIEFPQALSSIMTGINQTTMMAMAMVVIASMIGAEGIGAQVLISIRRMEVGKGFQAGLAIVFLAIILDRVLQGAANRLKEAE
ncbi:ABC transporter permease [Vallitalea guaymasensis]|uniref:ABC transporter permease subunit n=1 Tax=Vallitalea guaymasensis TaxID=1185412 RepID=A0A8J8SBR2_9FIRM|nr:ABC transporter permease subunit [Vallitalea guaymasensis]QUH28675.1 ABC transporter permease subunit [Vallitalea guaymasensis]